MRLPVPSSLLLAALAAGCNVPNAPMPLGVDQQAVAGVTNPITAIADGHDKTQVVTVNPSGQMSTSDSDTQARLDTLNGKLASLSYDSTGSVRVATTGTSTISGSVAVTNLPAVQSVAGTVSVDNLPAVQNVSGNVAVSNFPAVQPVAGSVAVSNLPAVQNVSGSVTVANMPATQTVAGSVSVSNLPSVQNVNITGGSMPTTMAPTKTAVNSWWGAFSGGGNNLKNEDFYDIFFTTNDIQMTLLTVSPGGTVRLGCWQAAVPPNTDDFLMLNIVIRNGTDFIHEFVHPLQVHKCTIVCLDSNGCSAEWAVAAL